MDRVVTQEACNTHDASGPPVCVSRADPLARPASSISTNSAVLPGYQRADGLGSQTTGIYNAKFGTGDGHGTRPRMRDARRGACVPGSGWTMVHAMLELIAVGEDDADAVEALLLRSKLTK